MPMAPRTALLAGMCAAVTVAQMCAPNVGGQQYDLSLLAGLSFTTVGPETPQGFKYAYQMQLCSDISKPLTPQCFGSSVCQYMNVGNEYMFLSSTASWSQQPVPTWGLINPSDPTEGLMLSFQNGGMCGSTGYRRSTTIYFNCTTTDRATTVLVLDDNPQDCPAPGLSCCYTFQAATPLACPGNPGAAGGTVRPGAPPGVVTAPQPAGAPAASGGLSGGWWFIISLAIAITLYIGGGCFYNMKYNDLTGADACPNLQFWVEFPGLVRDGCRVSYTFAQRLVARCWPRSQYQEVS